MKLLKQASIALQCVILGIWKYRFVVYHLFCLTVVLVTLVRCLFKMANDEENYPKWYLPQYFKKIPFSLHDKFTEAWVYFNSKSLTKQQCQHLVNADLKSCTIEAKHALARKRVSALKKRK